MENSLLRADDDHKESWHRLYPAHTRRCVNQLEEMGRLSEFEIVHGNSSIQGAGREKCAGVVNTNVNNPVIVQRR